MKGNDFYFYKWLVQPIFSRLNEWLISRPRRHYIWFLVLSHWINGRALLRASCNTVVCSGLVRDIAKIRDVTVRAEREASDSKLTHHQWQDVNSVVHCGMLRSVTRSHRMEFIDKVIRYTGRKQPISASHWLAYRATISPSDSPSVLKPGRLLITEIAIRPPVCTMYYYIYPPPLLFSNIKECVLFSLYKPYYMYWS